MFKTETHLHVSEVSPCSQLSAAEMVERYHKAGYKTLVVSDHFQAGYFDSLGDLSWDEKIDTFLIGYHKVKAAAEKVSMNSILAAEIQLKGSCNHYLLYGIDEAFLKKCPTMLEMNVETFYPYAKQHGITVIQAHPYRDNACNPTPEFVDGFEVYNSNPRHENFTSRAIETAQQYHKPMTAGSDAHRIEDIAHSGVITEQEIRTADDYIRMFYNNELQLIMGDSKE